MAITLDQNLGITATNKSATNTAMTHVTTAAAAAGSKCIAVVSFWTSTSDVLGAFTDNDGGTWTQDAIFTNTNGQDKIGIFSIDKPSGMASGRTLSVVTTGGPSAWDGGVLLGAASFLGVLTGNAVDTTATASTSGTTANTGTASAATANSLYFGGIGTETATNGTATFTTGNEIHDAWESGSQQGCKSGYLVTSGSSNIQCTLTVSSTASTGLLVIYKPAPDAAAGFVPHRMPLGV